MNAPESNETQRVLQYYTKQIEIDPGNPINYVFRSACYEYNQDYQSALNDALKLCQLDHDSWKGDHQAMKMSLKLGKLDDAYKIGSRYGSDESFQPLIEELMSRKEIRPKKEHNQKGRRRAQNSYYTGTTGTRFTVGDDRMTRSNYSLEKRTNCCNIS